MSESGFINYYRHCDVEWQNKWSCMCNDRCPVCGGEIEPYNSIDESDEDTDSSDLQGTTEMSDAQTAVVDEVEIITDAAAQHLIDALAAQRAADADGVNNADLTTQQAYDLGMRGTLVALDNIQAAVEFTKDEKEITIQGGLSALFDGINS